MLSFKPTISLSSFTFIKRLFSSSLLSAIRVVSSKHRRRRRASALSVAESYPMSEVRDSSPEFQAVMAQEGPGGATPHPRSGVKAERSHPVSEARGGA